MTTTIARGGRGGGGRSAICRNFPQFFGNCFLCLGVIFLISQPTSGGNVEQLFSQCSTVFQRQHQLIG